MKRCQVIVKLGDTSLNPRTDIGGGIKFRGPTAYVFIGTSEQLEVIPSKRSVDVTSSPHLIDLKAGRVAGRTDDSQITFFINQGTQGLQFATVAGTSYELAQANGFGIEIPTEWFLQNIRD